MQGKIQSHLSQETVSGSIRNLHKPTKHRAYVVFCFQLISGCFTESHAAVGTFVGIRLHVKFTYQQIAKEGSFKPSSSWKNQYNSIDIGGVLFNAKESGFVAANKWRELCASLWACQRLIKTIRFSERRKTIHLAVNPQSKYDHPARPRQGFVHSFQLKKR